MTFSIRGKLKRAIAPLTPGNQLISLQFDNVILAFKTAAQSGEYAMKAEQTYEASCHIATAAFAYLNQQWANAMKISNLIAPSSGTSSTDLSIVYKSFNTRVPSQNITSMENLGNCEHELDASIALVDYPIEWHCTKNIESDFTRNFNSALTKLEQVCDSAENLVDSAYASFSNHKTAISAGILEMRNMLLDSSTSSKDIKTLYKKINETLERIDWVQRLCYHSARAKRASVIRLMKMNDKVWQELEIEYCNHLVSAARNTDQYQAAEAKYLEIEDKYKMDSSLKIERDVCLRNLFQVDLMMAIQDKKILGTPKVVNAREALDKYILKMVSKTPTLKASQHLGEANNMTAEIDELRGKFNNMHKETMNRVLNDRN